MIVTYFVFHNDCRIIENIYSEIIEWKFFQMKSVLLKIISSWPWRGIFWPMMKLLFMKPYVN